jgi:uncharacterized protein GlcG (DUF336 family)
LKLFTARTIVTGALAYAKEHSLKPLAVGVLDDRGALVANGAISLGMGSRALMKRAEQQAFFIAAAGAAIGGALVPVPGGVLIKNATGKVLGAVGISGDTSDNDEAAALAGIAAAKLEADPG